MIFFQPRLASPIFDGIGRLSNQAQDDWEHPVQLGASEDEREQGVASLLYRKKIKQVVSAIPLALQEI